MKEFFWCEPMDPRETPCVFDAHSFQKLVDRDTSHTRCIRHGALVLGYGKFLSKEAAQKHVKGED
jgi:hypothetical protein